MLSRGAVAQLGERRVRNAKVEGSIPFRSTINSGVFGGPIAARIPNSSVAVRICRDAQVSRVESDRFARWHRRRCVRGGFDSSLSHLNVILKGWVNEISNDVECVGAGRLQRLFA